MSYSTAIESAATLDTSPDLSDFAACVQRVATRRGFIEAPRLVVLGDGSAWIWNTALRNYSPKPLRFWTLSCQRTPQHRREGHLWESQEGKQWI